jgi:hypothetical protein
MAIIVQHGFDALGAASQIYGRLVSWSDPGGDTLSIRSDVRHASGRAIRVAESSSSARFRYAFAGGAQAETVVHVAMKRGTTTGTGVHSILFWASDAGTHLFVRGRADNGTIEVVRGSTVLVTVTDCIRTNWDHFMFRALVADSGGEVEVWRNGTLLGSFTGDTNEVTGTPTRITLGSLFGTASTSSTTGGLWFDDLVVTDGAMLGDVQVGYYPVNSDETPNEWTRNGGDNDHGRLSQVPTDGDTTYLESNTPGNRTRHGVTPGLTGRTIYAVTPVASLRLTEAGTDSAIVRAFSDAADEEAQVALSTAYREYAGVIMDVDPDTTAAWTDGALDLLELELEHAEEES